MGELGWMVSKLSWFQLCCCLEIDRVMTSDAYLRSQFLQRGFSGRLVEAECSAVADKENIHHELALSGKAQEVEDAVQTLMHMNLVTPELESIVSLAGTLGDVSYFRWFLVDVRFAYCALSSLTILDALDQIDVDACVDWILRCMNYEGSFGPVPRAESHAAYVFCAVQALALVDALEAVDVDRLGWWLCERQTPSGGFNGRPEKARPFSKRWKEEAAVVWWILSALVTLDRAHWIDMEKLADFIALAQDQEEILGSRGAEDGGIADRPGDVPDVFHTFFGLAGLSLMRKADLAPIHCVYALPLEVVHRMHLPVILSMYERG
eukprot:g3157.t2